MKKKSGTLLCRAGDSDDFGLVNVDRLTVAAERQCERRILQEERPYVVAEAIRVQVCLEAHLLSVMHDRKACTRETADAHLQRCC